MQAAYTFDAGPNAVIFTTNTHVAELLQLLVSTFPPPAGEEEQYVPTFLHSISLFNYKV